MDKAKKLAEQAQQKLDEAQQGFGAGQSEGAKPPPTGAPVEYDAHGRPVRREESVRPPGPAGGESASAPPAPVVPPDVPPAGPAPEAVIPPASSGPPPVAAPPPATAPDPADTPLAPPPAGRQGGDAEAPPGTGQEPPEPRDEYAPPKLSSGDPLAG